MHKLFCTLTLIGFVATAQAGKGILKPYNQNAESLRQKAQRQWGEVAEIDALLKGVQKYSRHTIRLAKRRRVLKYFARINQEYAAVMETPLLIELVRDDGSRIVPSKKKVHFSHQAPQVNEVPAEEDDSANRVSNDYLKAQAILKALRELEALGAQHRAGTIDPQRFKERSDALKLLLKKLQSQ